LINIEPKINIVVVSCTTGHVQLDNEYTTRYLLGLCKSSFQNYLIREGGK
jgi:hypothetical protein